MSAKGCWGRKRAPRFNAPLHPPPLASTTAAGTGRPCVPAHCEGAARLRLHSRAAPHSPSPVVCTEQYSTTKSANASTFTKGIVKSVYLVGVARASASIEHVAPRVFYRGAYPTEPLTDASAAAFSVDVVVHLSAPAATRGTLAAAGAWPGGAASAPVTLPAGASNFTLSLPAAAGAVRLWWPAQTPGAQPLYNLTVSFTEEGGAAITKEVVRRVGFRVFTLVTGNDTDPTTLAGRNGQDGFTMRFKVNGADIWARGASVVPMEELEGRATDVAHQRLVQSAAEGGFNTLRVWGGGIYQHDSFYDACDELGVLVYHDMMYPAALYNLPAVTPTQEAELRHQVRRLSAHPSVALWTACNECSGAGLYESFVMTTVVEEDPSRPPWPASPSKGWASGVDALWSLPNGEPLASIKAPATPRAPLAARAPLGGAANASCSYVANEDYDHSNGVSPLPHVLAATPDACCALCTAEPACAAATYDGKTCWMKNADQAAIPGFTQNTVGVWPARSGPAPDPIPPPAPAGKLKCMPQGYETHGVSLRALLSCGAMGGRVDVRIFLRAPGALRLRLAL